MKRLMFMSMVAAGAAAGVNAAEMPLGRFVSERVLPFVGPQVSSSGFVAREIDAADSACDERWCGIRTKAEYDAARLALRREMLKAIGTLPERTPLNAKTVGAYRRDGYSIEKVIFESMPGVHVTGNLFIPDGTGRRPVVVMSCGHADSGKDCDIYLRACVLAARRGFVAFMFDPYQQGERRLSSTPLGSTTFHTQMGLRASLIDWSAPLLRIWDGMRAIDYVLTRPEVDGSRLGYMGQSGGGTMTALMEAADDRIKAAAPSCFLTSLRALCQKMGPQDGEQNICGQLAFGLNHTGYVLIPDIPIAVTCKFDDAFPYSGVQTLFRTVRKLEANVGLGERAYLNCAPGPHGWTETTETASVRFLAKHLMPGFRGAPVCREDDWLLDLGFDLAKADRGLSADESGCAPGKRTENIPGDRHIFDVIADRLAERRKGVRPLAPGEKRARAVSLAKVKTPAQSGFRSKETFAGEVDGCDVTRVVVQYPVTGAMLPAVTIAKKGATEAPVLICAAGGRTNGLELASVALADGHPVMIADVTGVGEIGSPMFIFYGAKSRPDEGLGAMCYLLGEPLVGRRATDMLVLADVLASRCGGRRPQLVASGFLAVPAAHARAADAGAFSDVVLSDAPKGWREVLMAGAKDVSPLYYADIVPRACLDYDWRELLGGESQIR